jgi:DNA mismatch endonuclease (patch repair protein)
MDHLPADQRSKLMSLVRNKDTTPELAVRRAAHSLGLRFRLHRRGLPGSPDIVFPRWKTAILVHGCFWHQHPGCKRATIPQSRTEFWKAKLARNVERDEATFAALKDLGWRAEIIWECEVKEASALEKRLRQIFSRVRGASEAGAL